MVRSRRTVVRLCAIAAFLAGLALPALASHSTGHTLWTSKCDPCHTTTPSGTQLNAAGSSSTVLTHVISNQATMAGSGSVTALTTTERQQISQYILTQIPTYTRTTAFNTATTINVNGHITLGTVSFSSVVVSNPPNGSATVSGTTITYTPDAGFVGTDSFTYRGGGPVAGDTRTITVTVNPPPVPVITSSLAKSGTVGVPLSYTIVATNSPTSYGALSLPPGLSRTNAVISGTPTTAGTDTSTISATNAGGTDTATLTFTIAKGSQSITFPLQTVGSRVFSSGGTFVVSPVATASSGLAVTYASSTPSVCTVAGTTVTMVAGGTCTITASQAGNANWNAALNVSRSVTITPATQSISFPAQVPAARNWAPNGQPGNPFTVSPVATANSGLPITYGSSTPSICTVAGTTVTIVAAGTCTITASQPGDASWQQATQATQAVTINAVAPGAPTSPLGSPGVNQATLSFTAPALNGGSPITGYKGTCNPGGFTASALASPVTVTGLTNGVAYTCFVQATTSAFPAGGTSSATVPVTPSAAPVPPSFTSAASVTGTVLTPGTFNVTATGTPTPTVSLAAGALPSGVTATPGTGVLTLSGTPASGTAGAYPLTFTASSTSGSVNQSFTLTIGKRSQVVTYAAPPDQPFSATPVTLAATTTSNGPVTFDSLTPAVCTIAGNQLTWIDAGSCTTTATQAGTADYLPADSGKKETVITAAPQAITFPVQAARPVGVSFGIAPAATASSGLAVSYASNTPGVCSVAGTVVTPFAVGTCQVSASQGGDSRWLPAADVAQDIAITLAAQAIDFPVQAPLTRPYAPGGTFPIAPLATASSGLPVTYGSQTPAVCTVGGSTVTIVTVGLCTITADQPGNATFAAAATAVRNVGILAGAPGAPAIGLATPGNGQATIEFTAPANDGGNAITSYNVTCNPGNKVAAGTASPITITGLANGTTYNCSVAAVNGAGTGAASATVAVTPAASAGAGAALWSANCQACHGPVPGGTRFNAVADSTAILNHVFTHQPVMSTVPALAALTEGEKADIMAYIAGFLPAVQVTTAPNVQRAVSLATNVTLNSSAGTYTGIQVVTPPAHGTLGAFNGTTATYTPNPGYSGPDAFTWRAINAGNGTLVSSLRTANLVVSPAQPVLTAQVVGTGTGTIVIDPDNANCTSNCQLAYDPDTVISVFATAGGNSTFAGWGGACSGTGDCIVAMDASKTVTATFQAAAGTTFQLTVGKSGNGTGTVTSTPAGIACGATCAASFNAGTALVLDAVADAGSVFAGWSGNCAGTGACNVTMDGVRAVTAQFTQSPGVVASATAALDFGGQSMGTTSPARAVTLTNPGATAVTFTQVASSSPQFAVTHNCGVLAPAASCTASVTFTPAVAAGALNAALPVAASLTLSHDGTGLASIPLAGTAEKSLVTHYYRSILRRAPDAPGHAFWHSEAARMAGLGASVNETWFSMSTSFYFSPEYLAFGRDDAGFVSDLYNTFFNRPADAGGLGFWTGQLAQGMPREVVLVSFMFSTEFATFTQAIFGNVGARAEVDVSGDFYRGLLSRLPDTGGFNFWVGQFRAAQCAANAQGAVFTQVESISSQFAQGGEYAARARSNAQYVGDLYNAFLRRGGDLGGVQFWVNALGAATLTREQVRQQFVASGEFVARVNAIVAQGCLP